MSLQERIQARLDELGLTPITAATRKGYSRDLIRNVMRTGSRPRIDTLKQIADALSVAPEDLLDEPSSPLARRIRERMIALGTNQFRVSLDANLGSDYIRDILRGKIKEPSAVKLASIASTLETTPEWLLFGEASGASKGSSVDAAASPSAAPAGSRNGAAPSTVFVQFSGELPIHIAAKVLALLEEGGK